MPDVSRTTDAPDRDSWDAVVIGAGPAGSLAARELARRGLEVLLVERKAWPRPKVCGACLSPGALRALEAVGLGDLPHRLGAVPLRHLSLYGWGLHARVALRGSAVLSRSALDEGLAAAATRAGVTLLTSARARIGDVTATGRVVDVDGPQGSARVSARIVVAADGLGSVVSSRSDLTRPALHAKPGSKVGLGATLELAPSAYPPGVIHMAVGEAGYVGLVRQEDGRLNVAAALDPRRLAERGRPDDVVRSLLRDAGLSDLPTVPPIRWTGTPSLTRRPGSPGADRILAVGDAAGYVEPFTGEGIAWALAGATELAPIAAAAAADWRPELLERWARVHTRRIAGAQRLCRTAAWTLRRPRLARAALRALVALPQLATPFVACAARAPLIQGSSAT